MKLKNLDLSLFLPEFMREEKYTKALNYAIQKQFKSVIDNIKYANIYARIDELPSKLLDELAWQFNIPEYNKSFTDDVKRNIIRGCMLTHHQRGTVGAVEKVVNDVFGEARIEEWFNYDGEPYHFKVYTSNPSASDEMLVELDRIIIETQNCRSYLEQAIVELYQSMDVRVGATCTIGSFDKFICK